MRSLPAGLLLLALAACRATPPAGPVTASLVGAGGAAAADAELGAGLVRLNREGQVVPALALRWAILDGGRDYLFRIDDAPGHPSARTIARALRTAFARRRTGPEALPTARATVAAVTATVVELRLAAPEPGLLALLAGPALAVSDAGRLRVGNRIGDATLLLPRSGADGAGAVLLRREAVGRAVARFRAGAAGFVTGGTFADLPVARAGAADDAGIRFDPATGLFGFAPARPADPRLLRALDLSLDRDRILEAIDAPGLIDMTSAPAAARPERLASARALVAAMGAPAPELRVAMPPGPGARLLFALAAQDWRRIGVAAVAVATGAPADLVLVDRVAPAASLPALACAVSAGCDPGDPAQRAAAPFIWLTAPVRWSLVWPRLDGFSPNALAAHPLAALGRAR